MSSRPFRVLVVADDRKLLRRISRFLRVFGYQVEAVADERQVRSVYEANPPDFLIVDGDASALQACRPLFAGHRSRHSFTFLMVRDVATDGLTEALRAGVDDFLSKPIVYGELLARMRSGARVLEYERRTRQQSAVDCVTQLLSRSAFCDRLQSELARNARQGQLALVVIDLDFFDNINRLRGYVAGDEVLALVADQLRGMSAEARFLASFGGGRFAAILPETTDAKAFAWAEAVREAIAGIDLESHDGLPLLTASLGVASAIDAQETANDLIRRAEEAARSAKTSGRNCVARCGQFDTETREWEELARQGRLFENTLARDIMVPCPRFVFQDDDVRHAADLLAHSRLSELPVVDKQGRLVGLFCDEQAREANTRNSGWPARVKDVMVRQVPTVTEDTDFHALMEFFMDEETSPHAVLVVRHDRPLGIVYRSGLAALSEPLTTATFAPQASYSATSDYLLVPDSWSAS